MMKQTILFTAIFFLLSDVNAQNKLLQKMLAAQAPSNIEFFGDMYLSDPITSISDGEYTFFVKVPIKKSIAQKTGKYTKVSLTLRWNGERQVYKQFKDVGRTMSDVAKDEGYLIMEVDLKDKENTNVFWLYMQDAEEKDIPLQLELKSGRNTTTLMSKGEITLALSGGKEQYINYLLEDKKDFVFTYSDSFSDPTLKNQVIAFFGNDDIIIHNFAWGERVPYTRELTNYRRHSAAVTYKGKDDKCYFAGLELYTETPYPKSDYKWDGQSVTFNNSELIPCNKIIP